MLHALRRLRFFVRLGNPYAKLKFQRRHSGAEASNRHGSFYLLLDGTSVDLTVKNNLCNSTAGSLPNDKQVSLLIRVKSFTRLIPST